jgi:ABC-type phosphate transport system substrate-binding protein
VNGNVLHVPTVLGAVVVHLQPPSLGGTKLKLDGELARRHLHGRITKWNDKRSRSSTPG